MGSSGRFDKKVIKSSKEQLKFLQPRPLGKLQRVKSRGQEFTQDKVREIVDWASVQLTNDRPMVGQRESKQRRLLTLVKEETRRASKGEALLISTERWADLRSKILDEVLDNESYQTYIECVASTSLKR